MTAGLFKQKTVAVIATLDTKGPEVAFLKSRIRSQGCQALIMDTGVFGRRDPEAPAADIPAAEIAAAGGADLQDLVSRSTEKGVRDRAIQAMANGAALILKKLCEEGRVHGAVGLGGAQGTEICTTAMRALPIGVPKVMVSTIASGKTPFGIYMGTRDITMMHSVVDILGINSLTRKILANAAGAVVGMVAAPDLESERSLPRVGVTIYGQTTPCGLAVKTALEERGYEVIAFHPNGTGGRAMEEMAVEHFLDGILDLSTHEVTDELFGGIHAGDGQRLLSAGRIGVPRLFIPGAVDVITMAEPETIPESYGGQPRVPHNPHITLVRTSAGQLAELARVVAERLNQALGPAAVAVPRKGWSFYNREGLIFYDPVADQAFLDVLKNNLRGDIPVYEFDSHINDPEFAGHIVPIFEGLMGQAEGRFTGAGQ
jgi:uncharacterized protein (UPF0261 family)